MENNKLNSYNSIFLKNQIPQIRLNARNYIYNKRIKYNTLSKAGLIIDNLKYENIDLSLFNNKMFVLNNQIIKNEEIQQQIIKETKFDIDNSQLFLHVQNISKITSHIRQSKRELTLKQMLKDKISVLTNDLNKFKETINN